MLEDRFRKPIRWATMESMATEHHGHEVMEMMMASGRSYSRASLAAEIRRVFGDQARFHTCSASGMGPEELIEFLAERGKFSGTDQEFVFNPGSMCQGH